MFYLTSWKGGIPESFMTQYYRTRQLVFSLVILGFFLYLTATIYERCVGHVRSKALNHRVASYDTPYFNIMAPCQYILSSFRVNQI